MFDTLTDTIINGIKAVLNFLPDSPFTILDTMSSSEFSEWLGFLNWFIPVNTFVAILESWLVCVGLYYIYQVVLRWVKAIE